MERTHLTQAVARASYGEPSFTSFRLSVLVPVYNERHVVETSVRRVLALEHELISDLQVIVVDDHSTDGTWSILQRLAAEDDRIVLLRNERNLGKGAALRKAIEHASGDISIVHDADLEYDPTDIPSLLIPFAKEGADAVYGSRYLSAPYRRALMHRHTTINKILTFVSNWLTDLNLTDLNTCYKTVKTDLLKSIPLRSDDFRVDVELTFKLAKRRARLFEAPVKYLPRTRQEGKKIGARDGILSLSCMVHFWLVDDLYPEDEYGSRILSALKHARRLNFWIAKTLRPFIGDRVLEMEAGTGTLTNQFIARDVYVACESNSNHLRYLESYSFGKPYLHVLKVNPSDPDHFEALENRFDTALLINVLDRVPDDNVALRNVWSALEEGGRALIMVPQGPRLYGSVDESLERNRRYTRDELIRSMKAAGFRIEHVADFNRASLPAWWLNSRFARRQSVSRFQLKMLDLFIPLLSRIDRIWPWHGLSLVAVGVKDS